MFVDEGDGTKERPRMIWCLQVGEMSRISHIHGLIVE